MPDRQTVQRAQRDKREGKSASTQAGEFIREEMHHIRQGKHGARSTRQAIAIGLSEARRAGVALKPPAKGNASDQTRQSAERDYRRGQGTAPKRKSSSKRAQAALRALQREGGEAATPRAIGAQARAAASRRSASIALRPRAARPRPANASARRRASCAVNVCCSEERRRWQHRRRCRRCGDHLSTHHAT